MSCCRSCTCSSRRGPGVARSLVACAIALVFASASAARAQEPELAPQSPDAAATPTEEPVAPPPATAPLADVEALRRELGDVRRHVAQTQAVAARAGEHGPILERGRRVYRRHCATCHGVQGNGEGATARYLRVRPRDFTRALYKWRTTPTGSLPTHDDLARSVRMGAPGTPMPAWEGRLDDADVHAVVHYIRSFSPRFATQEPEPPVRLPTRAPSLDRAAAERGRMMYVLMSCWTCHGMRGDGDGPAASTLRDDDGRPIEAYDFTRGTFRSGGRPLDVYRTFTTGVNGTPMPSYHEALLLGGDAVENLDRYREVLDRAEIERLRAFLGRLPRTDAIWALSERERDAYAARLRWDLVAFVLSLSRGSAVWRYLVNDPYVTP